LLGSLFVPGPPVFTIQGAVRAGVAASSGAALGAGSGYAAQELRCQRTRVDVLQKRSDAMSHPAPRPNRKVQPERSTDVGEVYIAPFPAPMSLSNDDSTFELTSPERIAAHRVFQPALRPASSYLKKNRYSHKGTRALKADLAKFRKRRERLNAEFALRPSHPAAEMRQYKKSMADAPDAE
jgi:hypothetical protein